MSRPCTRTNASSTAESCRRHRQGLAACSRSARWRERRLTRACVLGRAPPGARLKSQVLEGPSTWNGVANRRADATRNRITRILVEAPGLFAGRTVTDAEA